MLFLLLYITLLWGLIIIGGIIIVKFIAPINLSNKYLESIIKAVIAISMCIAWIVIMIILRDLYIKRSINVN